MDNTIEVKIGGEPQEVKMTYGLLNELARVIGDIDVIPMIGIEADVRDSIIRAIFSKRDAQGKIKQEVDIFNFDIDVDDLQDLLEWVGGHVLDFFLTSLERGKINGEKQEKRLKALTSISSGGQS